MRRFLFIILAALSCYWPTAYLLSDRFFLPHIQTEKEWIWNEPQPDPSVLSILSQDFHYLECGSQFFVFESADKKYVLKFFKHYRFRIPFVAQLFTKNASAKIEKKQKDQKELIESCILAYHDLPECSEITHLHLTKTKSFNILVKLTDKLHRTYALPIDEYDFILQKKGKLLGSGLDREKIDAILTLLENSFAKGIGNGDFVIEKNVGFLDGKAFFIDIGKFSKNEALMNREFQKREAEKLTSKFQKGINGELQLYFQKALERRFK